MRDGQLFVPFRLVLVQKNPTHKHALEHTWLHWENKHACMNTYWSHVNTHINLISEDLIAAAETSASSDYRLSLHWPISSGKCPIRRRRTVPVEMLVNRTIGNQFTCAVRARSNMGVNIYSFAWVSEYKKSPLRDGGVTDVLTWFEMLFSLSVMAMRGENKYFLLRKMDAFMSFCSTFKSYLRSRRQRERHAGLDKLTKNQNDKLLLTKSCSEKAVSYWSDNSVYGSIFSQCPGCCSTQPINTRLEQEEV